MIVSLLLYVLTLIASAFVALLPSSSFWPLPSGFTSAMDFLGEMSGLVATILPDNTFANLTGALTLVVTVNLFVIPWLAARNFRLPFAAMTKKE